MNHPQVRVIRSPRGTQRRCKDWIIEAAYRMLQNNLDPEVAENPSELVVYGGIGRAARNWDCFDKILSALESLEPNQTLLIQSGKAVGILPSHEDAPRVILANSNLVPHWATWENFHALERQGLIMYGQMTAGSWIYIGTQGILQGTYETFAACGRKHFKQTPGNLPLKGRTVFTAGLGGMGGAQPLAVKLAGGVCLVADVDAQRLRRRIEEQYLDEEAPSLARALERVSHFRLRGEARSIGIVGNVVDILEDMTDMAVKIDVFTDQTSAHDPLNGYIPQGYTLQEAKDLRLRDPEALSQKAYESMAKHVELLLQFKSQGSIVFDYGNNLRGGAKLKGVLNAFEIPGFVPEYIRPLFCEGMGPFRWVALSGDPNDIRVTDEALLNLFPDSAELQNWLKVGAPLVKYQGLPARICWLRHTEREKAGLLFNQLVQEGKVSAPLVIGRDHLDCGSVASPYRETEGMLDGSDAISDWPILNAMMNCLNGASWVSFHHGGGVGMGYSQHAGMVIVADGTEAADRRLKRVLNGDPAMGVLRHADAGYPLARQWADSHDVKIP